MLLSEGLLRPIEEGPYKEGALLAGTVVFYLCYSFFFVALLGKFLIATNEFMQRWLLQCYNMTDLTMPWLFLMDMAALSSRLGASSHDMAGAKLLYPKQK